MLNAHSWLLALLALLQLQYASVVADGTPVDLCGQFDSWNSTSPAAPYFFIPNAWGDDGSGGSCLNVTDNGAAWTLNYKWTGTPTLVKQYAYMRPWPSNLPARFDNISHLQLKATFSTLVDGTQGQSAGEQALSLHLNAIWSNVAVDMFLSTDAANSTSDNPPIEIMIWPYYSIWVRPLGWQDPTDHVVMIDGTNFTLYQGYNAGGQHVFSWLAQRNLTSVNADYGPLLKYIWQQGLLPGNLWLGQIEFGTEVLHAGAETIFSMNDYDVNLIRQGDSDDYTTTSTSSASATATSTTSTTRSTTPATTTASATPSTTSHSGSPSSRCASRGMVSAVFGLMISMMSTYLL